MEAHLLNLNRRDRSWKAMAVEIAQSLILNLDTFEMLAQGRIF